MNTEMDRNELEVKALEALEQSVTSGRKQEAKGTLDGGESSASASSVMEVDLPGITRWEPNDGGMFKNNVSGEYVEYADVKAIVNAALKVIGQQVYRTKPSGDPVDSTEENARLKKRVSELESARIGYASEFPLNGDGDPDVGNIHANIRALKAKFELVGALSSMASKQSTNGLAKWSSELQARLISEGVDQDGSVQNLMGEAACALSALAAATASPVATDTGMVVMPDDAVLLPRELVTRCLNSMSQAVAFGETGRGRPPSQTCMFEIEELTAALALLAQRKHSSEATSTASLLPEQALGELQPVGNVGRGEANAK